MLRDYNCGTRSVAVLITATIKRTNMLQLIERKCDEPFRQLLTTTCIDSKTVYIIQHLQLAKHLNWIKN